MSLHSAPAALSTFSILTNLCLHLLVELQQCEQPQVPDWIGNVVALAVVVAAVVAVVTLVMERVG